MSDILNHYNCSKEVYKQVADNPKLINIINSYYDAYRLGSQGSDFFYYNILFKESKLSNKIGKIIHTKFINEFFYYGLLFGESHEKYKDITLAYLMGFLTHHELDVITHPFIFYRTGNFEPEIEEIMLSKKLHKYYEILLDTAMTNYNYSKKAADFKPEVVFHVKSFTLKFLEEFYTYVLKKVYLIDLPDKAVKHALFCTRQTVRLFPDKKGTKRKLAKQLEKFFDNELVLSQFLYPDSTNDNDILNLDNNKWKHPVTGKIHTESYPELFNKAINLAVNKMKELYNIYQNGDITKESVDKILENKSYLTGLNAKEDQNLKFIDNDFKKNLIENY